MAINITMKVEESMSQLQADKSTVRSFIRLIADENVNPQFKNAIFSAWANGAAGAQAYTAGQTVVVTIGNPS